MQEKEWKAIVTCDPSYDGLFFYGVRTTDRHAGLKLH